MNERYVIKKADINDIEMLTKTRVEVLRAANLLDETADMSDVETESRRYYEKALQTDEHAAYLVFDGDKFIGAGGVSFYQIMPTYHNPSGIKAFNMNMYTNPDYRRQGIAMETLRLLVDEARSRGISLIALEATAAGRPLYEKFGFVSAECEMELPEV